jgi:hypothetical protein
VPSCQRYPASKSATILSSPRSWRRLWGSTGLLWSNFVFRLIQLRYGNAASSKLQQTGFNHYFAQIFNEGSVVFFHTRTGRCLRLVDLENLALTAHYQRSPFYPLTEARQRLQQATLSTLIYPLVDGLSRPPERYGLLAVPPKKSSSIFGATWCSASAASVVSAVSAASRMTILG